MTAILLIHPIEGAQIELVTIPEGNGYILARGGETQEAESFGFMIHRINVTDIEVRAKELKQTIMDLPTARNDTVIATKFEQIFDIVTLHERQFKRCNSTNVHM